MRAIAISPPYFRQMDQFDQRELVAIGREGRVESRVPAARRQCADAPAIAATASRRPDRPGSSAESPPRSPGRGRARAAGRGPGRAGRSPEKAHATRTWPRRKPGAGGSVDSPAGHSNTAPRREPATDLRAAVRRLNRRSSGSNAMTANGHVDRRRAQRLDARGSAGAACAALQRPDPPRANRAPPLLRSERRCRSRRCSRSRPAPVPRIARTARRASATTPASSARR